MRVYTTQLIRGGYTGDTDGKKASLYLISVFSVQVPPFDKIP